MEESFKVLIVDDEKDYRDSFRMLLESKGYMVGEASSANEAFKMLEQEYYPIVLSDIMMPGNNGFNLLERVKRVYGDTIQVIIVTGYGSIESAVKAMKDGATSYFIKSRSIEELIVEIEKAKKMVRYQTNQNITKRKFGSKLYLKQTKNPLMIETLSMIEKVADSDINVLLLGESGVGKEIFAHMIHEKSNRSTMSLIPINCQAISNSLLESELFGHEKGSFTGAITKNIGRFEEANGGTIFLDEIGEMHSSTQVKMLRVLDTRKIERIGSSKPIPVDFRLISATNRDIENQVKEGTFRDDLYYRINSITIKIPSLRERKEDIEDMIDFFIQRFKKETKKNIRELDADTRQFLIDYHYPGNVRELKNIIERMVVLSTDGVLRLNHMKEKANKKNTTNTNLELMPYRQAKQIFESQYIKNALSQNKGNITQTAQFMGISRRQLFNKITELDLKNEEG